jgi:hypothetical protein
MGDHDNISKSKRDQHQTSSSQNEMKALKAIELLERTCAAERKTYSAHLDPLRCIGPREVNQ